MRYFYEEDSKTLVLLCFLWLLLCTQQAVYSALYNGVYLGMYSSTYVCISISNTRIQYIHTYLHAAFDLVPRHPVHHQ